jgi:hypothetical protein
MAERCLTKPTLAFIVGTQREWSGKPSTTQLLNGTMQEYLKWKFAYAITPTNRAFALLGTRHHQALENVKMPDMVQEEQLGDDAPTSGIVDLLQPSEHLDGTHDLIDYKTFGSYRVKKILGIQKRYKLSETEVYKRRTKRKDGTWANPGDAKMVPEFWRDPDSVDAFAEEMQLNNYRLMAEESGYKIDRLQLQITVRDGGTRAARDNGIFGQIYFPIEIRKLPDSDVRTYYETKRMMLLNAIDTDTMPDICTDSENWEGRKCENFCDVAAFCPKGQTIAVLNVGERP